MLFLALGHSLTWRSAPVPLTVMPLKDSLVNRQQVSPNKHVADQVFFWDNFYIKFHISAEAALFG